MIVERLTYTQAAERVAIAAEEVERLEDDLRRARRSLRIATDEMHHALYERLTEPLP